MRERIISTAKAYLTDSSKVVVIPKKLREYLGEENTDLFIIKLDDRQRIILEPIKKNPARKVAVHSVYTPMTTGKNDIENKVFCHQHKEVSTGE